ncbi:MAG: UTP--glucose-1-phosphate uridylyltransferase GalU [Hyphomonadaceae bacterium]|nr:UTP--glucose-1-phosphate uridylyltransferase GalU [Hyphomonadaceae bacterium]
MTPQKIRKAVLPVAGLGTRVLPATKAVPKEMLAVFDRPAIQYVIDEALGAGIEHIVFVTGRNKSAIEDYFDRAYELEDTLRQKGKTELLGELDAILPAPGSVSFVRQQAPNGLGHAVWCARDVIGHEPFALLLPDMIMAPPRGHAQCLTGMMEVYAREGGNVIGVNACAPEMTHQYGIVATGAQKPPGFEITGMVEKPARGTAPSNLYINGRYILQPDIFTILATQERGAGGEIQITDAMRKLMTKQPFHGMEFAGRVYDCGDKIGYLRATVALALRNGDFGGEALSALREEIALIDDTPA